MRTRIALVGLVASVAGLAGAAAPASAAPLPIQAAGSTATVDVPVSCTFGPDSPVVPLTARVSVTAPNVVLPVLPYNASFRVELLGVIAPFDVQSFAISSTYQVTGAATPHAASFTDTPQPLVAGQTPTPQTHTRSFTPGLGGTVGYRFVGVSYDFKFAATDTIHAGCTLDDGPVQVRQTTVL